MPMTSSLVVLPLLAVAGALELRTGVRPRARACVQMIQAPPPVGFVWADDVVAESPPAVAPASPASVIVAADADAVGAALRERVEKAAAAAIAARGHFALAIPGGSVLKMCVAPPAMVVLVALHEALAHQSL